MSIKSFNLGDERRAIDIVAANELDQSAIHKHGQVIYLSPDAAAGFLRGPPTCKRSDTVRVLGRKKIYVVMSQLLEWWNPSYDKTLAVTSLVPIVDIVAEFFEFYFSRSCLSLRVGR